MTKRLISPSLLAADFNHLGQAVELVNQSSADWIHCDVMDGRFVPNISFGIPVIESIKKVAQKPLDVHLMIVEPDHFIEPFRAAGADILTVHYEACTHLHRTLTSIRELGMKAGVSLNPHTPVSHLRDIITEADLVLLMSVNPGFGGQKFIETTYQRVAELRELIDSRKSTALIEIDGGVNLETGKKLFETGADVLVAGSFVFGAPNPKKVIESLKNC